MSEPVLVGRDGDVVWATFEGLRFEVSEHDSVHRTHLLRVLQNDLLIHIDRLDLASARGRFGAVRAFKPERRVLIDQVLIALEVEYRACEAALRADQEPVILNGEDVRPEPLQWLWRNRIPRGMLSIYEGDPGLAKSLASLDLGARLSAGRDMPDGTPNPFGGEPAATVLLSGEDDPARVILPRFQAAGGDPKYLRLLKGIAAPDGERFPNLADVAAIRRAMLLTDARLLIVDPLAAYVPSGADAWRDDAIRRLLMPIAALVAELDVGLILVRHLTKEQHRPAIYRGQASIGIGGAARVVFVFAKHPADPSGELRCIATVKCNIAKEPPTLAYRTVAEYMGPPQIRWEQGTVPLTADELLNPTAERPPGDELLEAESVLGEILAKGPVAVNDVYAQARDAGVSRRTLERAKQTLNVRSRRDGPGEAGKQAWRWHPPQKPTSPSPVSHELGGVGDVGRNGRGDVGGVGDEAPRSPSSPSMYDGGVGDVGGDLAPAGRGPSSPTVGEELPW